MGKVKFPFHVKANGEYYPPGAAVEVEDVTAAAALGAEVMETAQAEEAKMAGRKPRKSE